MNVSVAQPPFRQLWARRPIYLLNAPRIKTDPIFLRTLKPPPVETHVELGSPVHNAVVCHRQRLQRVDRNESYVIGHLEIVLLNQLHHVRRFHPQPELEGFVRVHVGYLPDYVGLALQWIVGPLQSLQMRVLLVGMLPA